MAEHLGPIARNSSFHACERACNRRYTVRRATNDTLYATKKKRERKKGKKEIWPFNFSPVFNWFRQFSRAFHLPMQGYKGYGELIPIVDFQTTISQYVCWKPWEIVSTHGSRKGDCVKRFPVKGPLSCKWLSSSKRWQLKWKLLNGRRI